MLSLANILIHNFSLYSISLGVGLVILCYPIHPWRVYWHEVSLIHTHINSVELRWEVI